MSEPTPGRAAIAPQILRMMEDSAAELYEEAPCGYLCASAGGVIGKLNGTLLQWLGYRRDELVQRLRFQDLLEPGARNVFDTHVLPMLLVQGCVKEAALDLRGKGGNKVPVLANLALKRDAEGRPVLIRVSMVNAGERRRYERELLHAKRVAERAAATLERRVGERTSELADALARAEAAADAKSAFLSNMSHEIRTPLNCILGMAYLGLDGQPEPRQHGYLSNIERAGKHVLRIVSDILDVSNMDAGKLRIDSQPLDVADVVRRTVADFQPLAAKKRLRLELHCDPRLPASVLGDAVRLSQILGNYLGNAVKFTDAGGVAVRAELAGDGPASVRVRVSVRDTGIGIGAAEQRRLFQVFQQGDMSSSRKYGGTGLGLAICSQLAQMMDGAVGVDSALDDGSLFWFEVSLRRAGAAAAEGAAAAAPAPGKRERMARAKALLRGARLLLAEDNPLNQELARLLVEKTGAALTVVADGRAALAALARQDYDCVLMDVQMPLMDGCEATRRIRADAALAALPVIAITANAFNSDRERCLAAGMNDFLVKPIDPELFYATLARWVAGADLPPAAAETAAEPAKPGELVCLSVLAALVDNDPETMARLIHIFLDNAAATVAEMEAALLEGRAAALAPLGHRLKSSARAIGALRFADLCAAIETADAGRAGALVAELGPMLALVAAQIGAPLPQNVSGAEA
ncbi:PAS domain-containing hybrid sensor histidine kinase/response regulator [Janthinobacterium fluminis]|uniref:histidine kinase n=1 Tax=Janthinobacterium fluminis TaxID=2987524 RepID=A0ABT5JVK1_9BURK|nr:PAS domain-containing hybrid sensor histidine kinase/response regulator [Janthinobacterium fluminis]MDC8756450.1 response regulator [Janthinobacterium fluminis]